MASENTRMMNSIHVMTEKPLQHAQCIPISAHTLTLWKATQERNQAVTMSVRTFVITIEIKSNNVGENFCDNN